MKQTMATAFLMGVAAMAVPAIQALADEIAFGDLAISGTGCDYP